MTDSEPLRITGMFTVEVPAGADRHPQMKIAGALAHLGVPDLVMYTHPAAETAEFAWRPLQERLDEPHLLAIHSTTYDILTGHGVRSARDTLVLGASRITAMEGIKKGRIGQLRDALHDVIPEVPLADTTDAHYIAQFCTHLGQVTAGVLCKNGALPALPGNNVPRFTVADILDRNPDAIAVLDRDFYTYYDRAVQFGGPFTAARRRIRELHGRLAD